MFQLDKHIVKITSASLNAENHGDDHRTGMTIGFKAAVDASLLDSFDKKLRPTLFRKQKAGDQLDIERSNDGLVAVQFPKLAPFSWTEKFPGYEADLGPVGAAEPIQIVDATLKDIKFRALEGGSVELSAKLYFNPDEDEIGPLARLMKEDAELTLTPPSAQAAEDLKEAA